MKYSVSLEIPLARERMLEILENPDGMKHWQPGLESWEFLDDDRQAPGSRMRLNYDMNGRKVEMLETLQERSLPERMVFTYEAKGVWNRVVNRFEETSAGGVLWTQENEFRCTGFMALFCILAPGSFRRETRKSLELFRDYAVGLQAGS